MIANYFRKTKPTHILMLGILFLSYFLLAVFLVEKPIFSIVLILKKIGFLLLIIITFFLVQFINRKNQLTAQNGYVLLLLTILFGIFPKTLEYQDKFLAHFILLFAYRRIYSLKTKKNIKEKLLDSGILIGIAFLIYYWSILFFGILIISIFNNKVQNIRNLTIPIIGFISPVLIVFTYYFFIDSLSSFYNIIEFQYSFNFQVFTNFKLLFPIVFLIFLVLISLPIISIKMNSTMQTLKPSWFILLTHLFLSIILIIFTHNKDSSELIFIFFPLIIIITNFLQLIDKMIFRELIFITLLFFSFYTYFI